MRYNRERTTRRYLPLWALVYINCKKWAEEGNLGEKKNMEKWQQQNP
jgi:hypothetical protein